eukprot:CAMPEP_0201565218 /NCGR_PEP_ID=MMETSP0190_2-20130828/4175_1 /ASSEMBLY_ACC=CAM_ASM_000263 /TAXON_ID=37353 /ORGANISM="Rosalina sp." /LENGTH=138 /DNA_ID=CAMNT_0047982453 /DNA_START=39 /DNA_END=452 /DNA_ORIENTATION=+
MANNPSAPLLANQGQPIVMQPAQGQQVVYQQPPQGQQVVYQQQPQVATTGGYNQGNMYQQPIQPMQPAQGQQVIMQPQQQNQGAQPPLQQPNDQQLMEGLGDYNPQIVKQPEPIRVSGGKDGVGMSEGCARNPHIFTW